MRFTRRTISRLAVAILMTAAGAAAGAQDRPVYKPGNGVTLPVVVEKTRAHYTQAARDAGIQGTVQLETVVEADGSIGGVRVTKSLDTEHGLDEEAVKSMKAWIFEPGRRDGKPVAVAIVVEIAFTLK